MKKIRFLSALTLSILLSSCANIPDLVKSERIAEAEKALMEAGSTQKIEGARALASYYEKKGSYADYQKAAVYVEMAGDRDAMERKAWYDLKNNYGYPLREFLMAGYGQKAFYITASNEIRRSYPEYTLIYNWMKDSPTNEIMNFILQEMDPVAERNRNAEYHLCKGKLYSTVGNGTLATANFVQAMNLKLDTFDSSSFTAPDSRKKILSNVLAYLPVQAPNLNDLAEKALIQTNLNLAMLLFEASGNQDRLLGTSEFILSHPQLSWYSFRTKNWAMDTLKTSYNDSQKNAFFKKYIQENRILGLSSVVEMGTNLNTKETMETVKPYRVIYCITGWLTGGAANIKDATTVYQIRLSLMKLKSEIGDASYGASVKKARAILQEIVQEIPGITSGKIKATYAASTSASTWINTLLLYQRCLLEFDTLTK